MANEITIHELKIEAFIACAKQHMGMPESLSLDEAIEVARSAGTDVLDSYQMEEAERRLRAA